MGWKRQVRLALQKFGIDVQRQSDNPAHNLLGLRRFGFRSILDIGAHAGQFGQLAVRSFPEAHVHSFEPLAETYEQLKRWAARSPRVTAYPFGLGAEDMSTEMHVHTEHTYSSSLLPSTALKSELYPMTIAQHRAAITIKRLDDIVDSLTPRIEMPLLIKMDVQGFEARVIAGGPRTFGNAKACVTEISLDSLYEGQATFDELYERFKALGLGYAGNLSQVYGKDGHVIYLDAVFVRGAVG